MKNDILPQLAEIKDEFTKTHDYIEKYVNERMPIKVFENFNGSSLEAAEKTEYYSVFKEDFAKLNEIKSTINFLIKNLPQPLVE